MGSGLGAHWTATHGEPVAMGNDKKDQGHTGPWRGCLTALFPGTALSQGSPGSLSPALVSGSEA